MSHMHNRSFVLLFVLLLSTTYSWGQKEYFQQEVNYTIDVSLNDEKHLLDGKMQIEYINNSPDALERLIIHLWPNAYKNTDTNFAKQKVSNGSTAFYFAAEEYRGGFNTVSFSQNGKPLNHSPYEDKIDIASLELSSPLAPGATCVIDVEFQLDIPRSYSRLGHVGQSYQMTQWYPKPAVYDRDGWHPMPYLDMGEFYSEFGSFDVSIDLPANYVVGASGQLMTESEKQFLNENMARTQVYLDSLNEAIELGEWKNKTEDAPTSSTERKTIRYVAENVHDFAWFADKEFKVVGDEVTLESGKKVETYVMFTEVEEDLWKDAITYVNRSVKFYSDKVGEYPWPHATAIQSALSAGAGMEYPMITVIGESGNAKSLDIVITHEVGHNWFYGILGTNERMHAWMDEGLNSYYEGRYTDEYYPKTENGLPGFLKKDNHMDLDHLGIMVLHKNNAMQPPSMDSEKMWQGCYFLGSYVKVPMLWSYLDEYIGEEAVDSIMQAYYQEWKFKHPSPSDLQLVMENHSDLDFDWIFDHGMKADDKMDYKVKKVDGNKIVIRNLGKMDAPVKVVAFNGDEVVDEKWLAGFEGEKTVKMNLRDASRIQLDPEYSSPDYNRSNNDARLEGLIKRLDKPGIRMLGGLDRDRRADIYMLPLLAGNAHEGFMISPMLHNYEFPGHRVRYAIMPFFGTKYGTISGMADIKLNNFIRNNDFLRNIELGYNFKSFIFDRSEALEYNRRYLRHTPRINVLFNADRSKRAYSMLSLRYIHIQQEESRFENGVFDGFDYVGSSIFDANFEYNIRRAVDPWYILLNYRQSVGESDLFYHKQFSRISATFEKTFTYNKAKGIHLRLFGGYFISNENKNSYSVGGHSFQLTGNGHSADDAWFDDNVLGRNVTDGLAAHQVVIRDAGFKNAFPLAFNNGSGYSNNWMLSMNLWADLPKDLPLKLPLKPYFDLAYLAGGPDDSSDINDNLWWSGGVAVQLPFDILSIYVPVINSENLKLQYLNSGQDKFFNQISFRLNLKFFDLDKTLNRFGL